MNIAMKKYIKAILNLAIALIILLLIIWLVPKGIVFFSPFVIGWIIACIAGPFVKFFEEKMKIKRKAGSAFVVIVVIGLVILVLYLIGGKLIREIIGFLRDLPTMWVELQEDFTEIADNLNVIFSKLPKDVQVALNTIGEKASDYAMDLISKISTPTIVAVGNVAKQLPTIIIGIIMCLLSAYFFVAERGQWHMPLQKVMSQSLLFRLRMVRDSMFKAVGGYFKAQLKIEIWMYLLLIVGLAILKVEYTLLIALGVAFLDFLPFFGTGTVMVPWAIIKFLSADYKMTIGLLVIWGVGQLVRQIIQPKIVGDSMGMAPLPTLILLYIGYMVGGVLGMIFAVPIGIIVKTMYIEGALDTTKNSILILSAGLNRFRKITLQDMSIVDSYRKESEADIEEMEQKNGKL